MKVLSIDPGYERLGIAIIARAKGGEELLYSDCFKTSSKLPFPKRLELIGKELERLIKAHKPDMLATETLYFTTNQKTAMEVAGVRGVILYIGAQRGLPVAQYTPLEIKVAVTGYGKSDKKQVMSMVERLITIKKSVAHDDEYDAIAIGLTCLAREKF